MIVLGEKTLEIPGVITVSWLDDPRRVPRLTKVTPRAHAVRMIVVHTVNGKRGLLRAGSKASDALFAWTRSQRIPRTPDASWDITVGTDGRVAWQNDVATAYSWHCTQPNPYAIGMEMVQDRDGSLYEATIDATCRVIAFLCESLGIQKQLPWQHLSSRPYAGCIERLDPRRAGVDCVGVFGHRNIWCYPKDSTKLAPERGFGDPGDLVFEALVRDHRFEPFEYHGPDPEDLRVWRGRQTAMGFGGADVDGIALTQTTAKLKQLGYPSGIWVDRPMPP